MLRVVGSFGNSSWGKKDNCGLVVTVITCSKPLFETTSHCFHAFNSFHPLGYPCNLNQVLRVCFVFSQWLQPRPSNCTFTLEVMFGFPIAEDTILVIWRVYGYGCLALTHFDAMIALEVIFVLVIIIACLLSFLWTWE